MRFWSSVLLAKLALNTEKTERTKLSRAMITPAGFVIFSYWEISLGTLDSDVALGSSTFLTMVSLILMEVI